MSFSIQAWCQKQDTTTALQKGIRKFKAEDYKEAIKVLEHAVKESTRDPDIYFYLAESQMAVGHYKGAMAAYNKALALDSQHYKALKNRGKLKAELGDYRGSIEDFNKAIAVKSDYTDAYFNRGLSKYRLEEYDAAMADFNTVIEHDSKDGEAHYWRGHVKLEQGAEKAGCKDLSKAGELGYFKAYESIKEFCNN